MLRQFVISAVAIAGRPRTQFAKKPIFHDFPHFEIVRFMLVAAHILNQVLQKVSAKRNG